MKMERETEEFKKNLKETNEKLVTQGKLLLPFCEKELLILGAEILKWTVKKQGVKDGYGYAQHTSCT